MKALKVTPLLKKLVSSLFTILMIVTCFSFNNEMINADSDIGTAGDYTYVIPSGVNSPSSDENTPVTNISSTTTDLSGGWYVVKGSVTANNITFADEASAVNIILEDDAILNVDSIKYVNEEGGSKVIGTLNIWTQSSGTGQIKTKRIYTDKLNIYGGTITANNSNNDEAILSDDVINIVCGTVTAIGRYCGIKSNKPILISNGSVYAEGTEYGLYSNESITISGGTVTGVATNNTRCFNWY